ncbi:MAG TPA: methyltransferase domain-containing protein [Rudaea sp.]|jgi:SAM-dependent methyltransferase
MTRYAIDGGRQGKERLKVLAEVMFPTTSRLLGDAGLRAGMSCLDVACGGGDVTLYLARQVGPHGKVVGTDADAEIIALARQDAAAGKLDNVEFRVADALVCPGAGEQDLVYARFILTHLSVPSRCVDSMVEASRHGGMVVVEDIDFTGGFCHPHCAAYQRYTDLYRQVVKRRGGDPDIGPKLPGMLRRAGLQSVRVNVVQPTHIEGDGKYVAAITMARIADSVVAEGLAGEDEIEDVVAGLSAAAKDPETVMGLPRIFQSWGKRS